MTRRFALFAAASLAQETAISAITHLIHRAGAQHGRLPKGCRQ